MKVHIAFLLGLALLGTSCSRKSTSAPALKPTGVGAAIVESSGGKQFAQTGSLLPQPVVVQVNDAQGAAVAGALVEFSAVPGVTFDPPSALSDSSGQVTTNVSLGRNGRTVPDQGLDIRQVAQKSRIRTGGDRSRISADSRASSQ